MAEGVKTHRRLSTERVVDAALALADASGLESLTIRRLAAVLGVSPMAVYRHVRNKDHLLDLMVDRLLEGIVDTATESRAWPERLRNLAASVQVVLEVHPSAPILLSRPYESVHALQLSEALLEILAAAGFDVHESVRLMQIVTGMILGPAIHRATYAEAWRKRSPDARGEPSLALTAADFPILSRAGELLTDWSGGPEADRRTIELLVAGVEALAPRSGDRSGRPAESAASP